MPKKEATLLLRIKQTGGKVLGKLKENMDTIKKGAAVMGAALAGALVVAFKAFAEFEKGLIGVGKTTGIAGSELRNLGKDIQQMSKEIPASTAELLEIAQAAGQLGVKGSDNIAKFTEVMAKLAFASDVAGEEGAKAIARILNVTGDGVESIDRFSAALVDLGNNAAASESEILAVATRVSGATGQFQASSAGILGISTALKAMGRQAEEAGSTVGRVFLSMDQAIQNGGTRFEELQRITGMTGDQLRKTFQEDSTKVFQAFINGLAKLKKNNENVTATLRKFDLEGVRIQGTIGSLISRNDLLNENLERSARAWEENSALNKEAEEAFKSLAARLQIAKNIIRSIVAEIGERLSPVFGFFIAQLSETDSDLKKATGTMSAFVTVVKTLAQAALVVKNIFDVIGNIVGTTLAAGVEMIGKVMAGDFRGAMAVDKLAGAEIVESAKTNFQEMIDGIMELENGFNEQRAQMDEDAKLRKEEREKSHQEKLNGILKKGEKDRGKVRTGAATTQITDEQKNLATLFGIRIKDGESTVDLEKRINQAKENARAQSMSRIATLAQSNNKALAAIGKAAGITQIAIDTPVAVSKALAAFPPPFNFAAAGAVAAAMAVQAARIAGVQLADGGIVQARQGGTPAILGEGGRDEAVIPLDDAGGIGTQITINTGVVMGDESQAREFAVMVDSELLKLRQNNESQAFDGDVF